MKKSRLITLTMTLLLALGLIAACSTPEPSHDLKAPEIYGADIQDNPPGGMISFNIMTNIETDVVHAWQGNDAPLEQSDYLTHGDTRVWSFTYNIAGLEGSTVRMNISAENAIAKASLLLTIPIDDAPVIDNDPVIINPGNDGNNQDSTPPDNNSGGGGGQEGQQGKEPVIYDLVITKPVYAPGGTMEFNILTDKEAVSVDVWKGSDAHTRQFDYTTSGNQRVWAFKYDINGNAGDAFKMNVSANNAVGKGSWVFTLHLEEPGGQKGDAPHIFGCDMLNSLSEPGGNLIFNVMTDTDTATVDVWAGEDNRVNRVRSSEYTTEGNTRIWSFTYEISGSSGESVVMNVEANNATGKDTTTFVVPIS